ncbi:MULTISPECIES: nuclear transport factor 2 family protein [unclassified Novosphingobium]|uniref:nuclear transport factor 2 family protein n=1 Tax=unclassified Novosphingobium TaxID=2644732 RepID=UPI000D316DEA|nr:MULTISPECIES: nuclear transport factor 2 family protein [unclassified Novosphingobium]PTR12555.1 SnoaL-like protein [Novosphingobium sp. GV055]PUB06339.1 SnoaL-like protein [Novosphingobium sp. GV061]PUB22390.1 SnoaL-like protein [Novosphingobium sp. GV079]PUB44415.1 SnoaL-like protein [Novosphingobium sp. GV027]
MKPLERLIAIEEIRGVKARYFRCVDTRDWDGLAQIFTEDITLDRTYGSSVHDPWTGEWTPPLPPEPLLVQGREAVVAMVRRAVEMLRTVHQGYMPEFNFEDDNNARVIWAMTDELRDREGRLIVSGRGHYFDLYRRTAEGWRLAEFQLTRLSLVKGDGQRN